MTERRHVEFNVLLDLRMMIPLAVRHRSEMHAGFHKSPSQQHASQPESPLADIDRVCRRPWFGFRDGISCGAKRYVHDSSVTGCSTRGTVKEDKVTCVDGFLPGITGDFTMRELKDYTESKGIAVSGSVSHFFSATLEGKITPKKKSNPPKIVKEGMSLAYQKQSSRRRGSSL